MEERAARVAGVGAVARATRSVTASAARAPSAESPRTRPAPTPATPVNSPPATVIRGATTLGKVILGIDPGTRVVGWGAIEITVRGPRLLGAGAVVASEKDLAERLGTIRRELDRLIAHYRPSAVAVEEAFANKNVQSALRIGEGRGVVLSCAAAAGVPIHQYTPATAKKAIVGNGAAHKTQVAAMVARRLELREVPKPLDATDALALALTHLELGVRSKLPLSPKGAARGRSSRAPAAG